MENFVVSARKYRPVTFDTVVGQQSITNTLLNAIKSNHLAQAFLFCGPRGVGKTTCARILAKTINCFNRKQDGEACSICDSCTSFQNGQSLNVYELDAASNNSVDDIRQLVDQVRFAPQLGKYKVYIIDEVHMLSTAAFNAFLKTLEEPPAHAIFILATTEKNKIIPTILSRCQIFDFNRIQIKDIADHLAKIGLNEQVETEYDALLQIAAKADGGLRDALSMFDQIVTYAGSVTFKATIENLNILDYEYYFKVTDALKSQQVPSILMLFDEVLKNGFDGNNFINGLAEHFRNLLVCKDEITLQLLQVSDNSKTKYSIQANGISQQYLIQFLEICNKCDIQYKQSKNQRLLVELSLLQIMSAFSGTAENSVKHNFIVKPYYLVPGKKPNDTLNPIIQKIETVKNSEPQIIEEVIKSLAPVQNDSKEKVKLTNKAQAIFSTINNTAEIKAGEIQGLLKNITLAKDNIDSLNDIEVEFDYGSKDFTLENVLAVWEKLQDSHKEDGNVTIYHLLLTINPILTNNHAIELQVANTFQNQTLNTIAKDITIYFRTHLQNNKILVSIIINKLLQENNKVQSKKEVLEEFIKQNPALQKMCKELDLDLEF